MHQAWKFKSWASFQIITQVNQIQQIWRLAFGSLDLEDMADQIGIVNLAQYCFYVCVIVAGNVNIVCKSIKSQPLRGEYSISRFILGSQKFMYQVLPFLV